MSTARTVAVFAIVIGCFAVLYPRIFHPTVLRIFGMQGKSGSDNNMQHPHQRGEVNKPAEDIKSHIRPGPHPGLRASAEMRQQQQQQGGSGRGMMGVVLPMYAVGIVLYLVYTIVKVFSKRQGARNNEAASASTNYGRSNYEQRGDRSNYEQRGDRFTYGDDFEDLDEDYKAFMGKKEKQRELEKLLLKADERHITEFEMRQLQRRLEETESQMTRILHAMQTVADKVDSTVPTEPGVRNTGDKTESTVSTEAGVRNTGDKTESTVQPDVRHTGEKAECSEQELPTTQEDVNLKVPPEEQHNKVTADNGGKSSDSSPDTDSFEVVSKTESSSFSVISTPTDEDIPEMTASATTPSTTATQSTIIENVDRRSNNVHEDDEDITVLSSPKEEKCVQVENIGYDEDIILEEKKESKEPSSLRLRKTNESHDQ